MRSDAERNSGGDGSRRGWIRAWPAGVFLVVVLLQVRALERVPLAAFGADGAPFLPHLQRQYARFHFEQHGLAMFLEPWATLRALDGHYPALLHLLALPWSWLPGGMHEGGFAHAAHLNLLFLALLAVAAARLTGAAFGARSGGLAAGAASTASSDPGAWGGAFAAALVLLVPGLFAAARRYYYDLPMTAAILAAAALLLDGRGLASPARALGAAVATSSALLIKWAAGLYLAPIWGLVLVRGARSGAAGRALGSGLAALALVVACCLPVALKPDGSFAFELGLGAGRTGGGGPGGAGVQVATGLVGGLGFYLEALWSAGLGPGLTVALGLTALLAGSTAEGRRTLLRTALVTVPPLLFLAGWLPKRDGRYLMPLLPWAVPVMAAGIDAVRRRSRPGGAAVALAVGLTAAVQVAWIDGPWPWGRGPAAGGIASPKERWRAWWWTGARRDEPVPFQTYELLTREVLALEAGGRVLIAPTAAGLAGPHAWQYYLSVLAPGRSSLVTLPVASDGEAFLEALARDVDVLVAPGEAGRPERLERWLPALCRCETGASSLASRFQARFPVQRTLSRDGLSVSLYARAPDREVP